MTSCNLFPNPSSPLSFSPPYSLGMLYKEESNDEIKQNIPLAVYLIGSAASRGHIRSMAVLGLALSDIQSWLGEYARGVMEQTRKDMEDRAVGREEGRQWFTSEEVWSESKARIEEEMKNDSELQRWGYNHTIGLRFNIKGSSGSVHLPLPPRPDCTSALPLIKTIVEYGYRPNDITRTGLQKYLSGDVWGALEMYEEAANLGVHFAQENTAFLYELISEEYCPSLSPMPSVTTNYDKTVMTMLSRQSLDRLVSAARNYMQSLFTPAITPQSSYELEEKYTGYRKIMSSPNCKDLFNDMATLRWMQVSKSGQTSAMREIADMSLGRGRGRERGRGGRRIPINVSRAALLYSRAASERGDIPSLMALASLVEQGAIPG
jgi:hypothetical protein